MTIQFNTRNIPENDMTLRRAAIVAPIRTRIPHALPAEELHVQT